MTITQTVAIPADHRLIIDVPREVPTGATARFEIRWFSREKAANSLNATLEEIWALCEDVPVTVDSLFEERRRDNEMEEDPPIILTSAKLKSLSPFRSSGFANT